LEPRSRPGRATILDVADAAGVSIKTVSRVFNDEPNVRASTRQRVLEVAGALDYHPNPAARSLAGRRSFLLGLVYENPSPNFVVDLQAGSLNRLRDERYRLLVYPCTSVEEVSGRMLALARASGLDGVILTAPMSDDARILAELASGHVPFVRLAPTTRPEIGPSVAMDDVAAATELIRHLLALGHRRIGHVRGNRRHPASTARENGFRSAMASAGATVVEGWIEQGDFTFASGLEAGRRILSQASRPTAIFAANDDMAAGVLSAANELGIAVPGELSIAGFDDSSIAQVVWPRLTTIHQPTFEMAEAATDMLIGLLDGATPADRPTMPYSLVVRGSTAPPPAAATAGPGSSSAEVSSRSSAARAAT
jgi:LacI family transcriptional regulator